MDAEFLVALKEIRKSPRKMRQSYIETCGLLPLINLCVTESFSLKEKIDVILNDHNEQCYCGNRLKFNKQFCSVTCRNKDQTTKTEIGRKNSLNKVTRAAKMKQTLIERYNVDSVQKIPSAKEKTKASKQQYYESVLRDTFERYKLSYDDFLDKDHLEIIAKDTCLSHLSEKQFNGMHPMTVWRHYERVGASLGIGKTSSAGEREINNWVQSLGFETISNDRTMIKPKELDILIPSMKTAIEFNGLFYHKDLKSYHKDKFDLCYTAGLTLLQFFEDEWYYKENIVKSIIKSKLQLNETVHARKCKIALISSKQALAFLDDNHLQGKINGRHYGLSYNDEIVSLMTVGKCRYYNGMEILRFANKCNINVVGGFTKLLKHAKANEKITTIYSYADMRISTGKTYEMFGKFVKETEPGYFWLKNNKRISRYATQKHKLSKVLGDNFDPTLTENDNMLNNNYSKIYDCGHRLYLL